MKNGVYRIISSAEEFYRSLFEDMERAERSIRVQMYCIMEDPIGEKFIALLMKKARAGVEVDLVYDSLGCLNASARFFDRLAGTGARVLEFHPINPSRHSGPYSLRNLFHRNHRKLVLIDSHVFYLGGMNVGARFLNWEDVMLRGEGGPMKELENCFHRVFREPGERPRIRRVLARLKETVQVWDGRPWINNYPIKRLYISAIKKSRERVWIAQAYFLPRRKLVKALVRAARRGVDVRIIIPDVSDIRVVDLAAWPALGRLLKNGVKVYRYTSGMMHAKLAVVDRNWLTLGSANLDSMSFYWNQEINLVVREPELVEEASRLLQVYEKKSRLMDPREPHSRPFSLRLLGRIFHYYGWIL